MTESEWLTSEDSVAMLHFVARDGSGPGEGPNRIPLSPRNLRLWACACARQTWRLLTDERSRNAILVASRYVDGEATAQELSEAETGADHAQRDQWLADGSPTSPREIPPTPAWSARCWAKCASRPDVFAYHSANQHMLAASVPFALQALLLRDIAGNPFRRTCLCGAGAPQPDCPRAARIRTPTVLAIARAAYEERGRVCERCHGTKRVKIVDKERHEDNERRGRLVMIPPHKCVVCPDCLGTGRIEDGTLDADRLAILADALEDAGADNEDILSHLRGPGPHVRGCFAIYCILGHDGASGEV